MPVPMHLPYALGLAAALHLACTPTTAGEGEGEGERGEGEGEGERGEGEGEPGEGEGEGAGDTLAARYPGDVGIGADPAVVWHEDFEQQSIAALTSRYDQHRSVGMTFDQDVHARSSGQQALRLTSGGDAGEATDLFKRLDGAGHTRLFVRWYVKHEAAPYHHSGMWFGGYNPAITFPNPQAGTRPDGDERISIAFEPVDDAAVGRRMDFYNVWQGMRSWQATQPSTSGCCDWYGNTVVHDRDVTTQPGAWQCFEAMVTLNDDVGSASGGALALWREDELVQQYTETAPRGYFIRDKFCPQNADAASCTDFAPAPDQRDTDVLNLHWRTDAALRLNWLWLQNYMSSGSGSIWFDDVVVATERVGCVR